MEYEGYYRCSCGAITIIVDGEDYSCESKNLKKFFPGLDLRKIHRIKDCFACNHCVNHFGLDLCGCGSGEPFGQCDNEFDECELPMQVVGEYTRVIANGAIGA